MINITDHLCWFVESLIDEVLKRFFQTVVVLFVILETGDYNIVELCFKVQQLLHHRLVLLGVDDYCSTSLFDVRAKPCTQLLHSILDSTEETVGQLQIVNAVLFNQRIEAFL